MKKDFAQLIKEIRVALRPEFRSIGDYVDVPEEVHKRLEEFESKLEQILAESGYSLLEFCEIQKDYFMDFSSDNPDEWIIKYDPNNPEIIYPNGLSID